MYNIYKYEALKAKEIADMTTKVANSPQNAENPFQDLVGQVHPRPTKIFSRGKN